MCPDFPTIGGATPAQVWAYATRELSGFTGTPRTNLLGEDATFEAGVGARKSKIDDIDATVSSRATQAQILSDATPFAGANINATISSRSSHDAAAIWAVAARQLTAITGTPRSDLIGSDASFEAAVGRPAKLDVIPYFEAVVEGSLLMDGLEQTLVEKTDDKAGLVEGMINLTPMAAGDTVVVREYMQVLSAGAYAKYAEETYADAQAISLLQLLTRISTHDIKVTIQQTAGTYRTFEYSFVRRKET